MKFSLDWVAATRPEWAATVLSGFPKEPVYRRLKELNEAGGRIIARLELRAALP